MNLLLAAGEAATLAGVFAIHAADWTGRRLYRWTWWPLGTLGALALFTSGAGWPRITAALGIAAAGGTLLSIAFLSVKTRQGWMAVTRELVLRQRQRKRRGE